MLLSAGEGRCRVEMHYLQIGRDRMFIITNVEGGHIGAITLAEKRGLQTIGKLGHRDDIISQGVAKILYTGLGEDITVVCGIHIDHGSKEEIETLVVNAQRCATHYLEEINHE